MKKLTLLAVFALVIAIAGPAFAAAAHDVGQPAVDFTLLNWDTKKDFVLASELKKSKMVFVWFSSTCASCRSEIIDIANAVKAGDIDKGKATIYFINIDFNDSNIAKYKEAQEIKDFAVLHDPKFTTPVKYGFRSTPALLVIGRDGNIAFKKTGYESADMKEVIAAITNAK